MTTVVQVSDDGGDTWRDLDYTDFEITIGLHERQRVPQATVTTRARQDIDPAQPFRIQINGETRFRGETESSGTVGRNGNVRLSARHRFASLVGESVDIDEPNGETSENIISAALSDSERGGSFSLQHDAEVVSLDEYVVESRDVGDVFADVMDRTGYVYWVEPATDTIRVQTRGGRGTWASLSSSEDGISVDSYDDGSVETVVNDVTVTPTRGEGDVTGTATNQESIDEYGRRPESYNIAYAAEQDEADAVAESLLQPTPLAEGDIAIPQAVGNVDEPLVNFTLDVEDASKGIDVTDLLVERQVIEQGRATVEGGEGRAQSIEDSNRQQRSDDDETLPGFLVGEGRIVDDSISREKLRDRAVDSVQIAVSGVIGQNLANSSVSSEKIADAAVLEEKLGDLSVSETKIQDDSISTPKLITEAVTANEIEAETITAAEIAAGTIGASRLFIEDWIPIDLAFSDDSPNTGDISWNSHELVYDGEVYDISGGDTSDRYVFWQFGNGFYSSSDTKPDLDDDDALVAINDNGEANRILQATEIHGGSIRTGTVSAAEIEAATITADLIDTLDLNAEQISITDNDEGIEFTTDTTAGGVDYAQMTPTTPGLSFVGRPTARFSGMHAQSFETDDNKLADSEQPFAAIPDGSDTGIEFTELLVDSARLRPFTDGDVLLGDADYAFDEVWAYDYVDASTGSPINDGGNPLEGLAEGHGPPDHAKRFDEDGNESGYSLSAMARSVWDVCREQERLIESQQERIDELEQRLSAIEDEL